MIQSTQSNNLGVVNNYAKHKSPVNGNGTPLVKKKHITPLGIEREHALVSRISKKLGLAEHRKAAKSLFKEFISIMQMPFSILPWLGSLFKGDDKERLRNLGSADIAGAINKMGQKLGEKFITVIGETHSTGMAKSHLLTDWIVKDLAKFKAQGFNTIAIELPPGYISGSAFGDGLAVNRTLNKRSQEYMAKSEIQIRKEFAKLGFTDKKEIDLIIEKGLKEFVRKQSGSLKDFKEEEMRVLDHNHEEFDDHFSEEEQDWKKRWGGMITAAKKLGMKVALVDATTKIHSEFQILLTVYEGLEKYIKELSLSGGIEGHEKSEALEILRKHIKHRIAENISLRDKHIASNLAAEMREGNKVLAVLGIGHALNGDYTNGPSAVKILRTMYKMPVINVIGEFAKMYDGVETEVPLKTGLFDLIEADKLKEARIYKTDQSSELSNANLAADPFNWTYGDNFRAVIAIPA